MSELRDTLPSVDLKISDYDNVKDINPFDIARRKCKISFIGEKLKIDEIKRLLDIDYSLTLLEYGEYGIQQDFIRYRDDLDYTLQAISEKMKMSKKERGRDDDIFPQSSLKYHRESNQQLKKLVDMFTRRDWLSLGNRYMEIACEKHSRLEGLITMDQGTSVQNILKDDIFLHILQARVCAERAIEKDPKLKLKINQLLG